MMGSLLPPEVQAHFDECYSILGTHRDPLRAHWDTGMSQAERAVLLRAANLPKQWAASSWDRLSDAERYRITLTFRKMRSWLEKFCAAADSADQSTPAMLKRQAA